MIIDCDYSNSIAVIGMSGRFPGSNSVSSFWDNICSGKELISIEKSDILPRNYIPVNSAIDDIDFFDAFFFNVSARDAETMDPQMRLFLECAWEALEDAGYDPFRYEGLIGVYAGSYANSYLLNNVFPVMDKNDPVQELKVMIGNEKDHLTTYTAYKLNLRGPAVTVQTACSTSLAAVHLGCDSLLTYSSDIVLAGGVTISVPQQQGYFFQEGGLLSSDGHCRPFDEQASGTIYSNGLGIVVLKRYHDAVNDGDNIYSIIRGSALSNDGSARAGYMAPGVKGQLEVVSRAYAAADVDPATISYIETHGTGTPLGDRIELEALSQFFSSHTSKKGFCAIGSVKSNIGHMGAASGVAGLIKTSLSLKHKKIPASLNCDTPREQVNSFNGPFYVNTFLTDWPQNGEVRRAGVSSFGLGGTNVHMIVEEAPPRTNTEESPIEKVLLCSAKTPTALDAVINNLSGYLKANPNTNISDLAYTLQMGRSEFDYRSVITAKSCNEVLQAIEKNGKNCVKGFQHGAPKPIVFFFQDKYEPHNRKVIKHLYTHNQGFRSCLDVVLTAISAREKITFADFSELNERFSTNEPHKLVRASRQLIIFFAIQLSLANYLIQLGIIPVSVFGSGIGRIVAGCVSGVFSLDDAIKLFFLIVKPRKANTDETVLQSISFNRAKISFTSYNNINWLNPEVITDNELKSLKENDNHIFLEITPRKLNTLQVALGKLWLQGVKIDWPQYYNNQARCRLKIPNYPFEKKRYWIEPLNRQGPIEQERPVQVYQKQDTKDDYTPPGNKIEKKMVELWEEQLGVRPIGVHENFFELGGHSLIAVSLVKTISEMFCVKLELRIFLELQSIKELSDYILKQHDKK